MIRKIKIITACLCALFLSCCDCDPCCGTTITYEVTGDVATRVSVEYINDYGDEEYHSSIALPWKKKFTIKFRDEEHYGGSYNGDVYPAYISATVHGGGHIAVSIKVDDCLVKTDSTYAEVKTVTARYAVPL